MPRATNNVAAHARTKKVLAATKGHKGSRSRWKRSAIESRMKAMLYSTRDRKNKKREFRALWIARINAASRQHDMPCNRFTKGVQAAGGDTATKDPPPLPLRPTCSGACRRPLTPRLRRRTLRLLRGPLPRTVDLRVAPFTRVGRCRFVCANGVRRRATSSKVSRTSSSPGRAVGESASLAVGGAVRLGGQRR